MLCVLFHCSRADRVGLGIVAALVILMVAAQPLGAQNSLRLFDLDTSGFPRIRGSFYLFSSKGTPFRVSTSDLALTENGAFRKILSVDCPEPSPPETISSVLVLDVSWSMGGPRLELAKAAALAWVDEMPLGSSECAVTSFSGWSNLDQDFTTQKSALVTAINRLVPNGGTDYQVAFMQDYSGAIPVASRGRHKRVIVFLTDGMTQNDVDIQGIKDAARASNVVIHCICIAMPVPTVLGEIAGATGGHVFGNVESVDDAVSIYRTILHESLNVTPCSIEWESAEECQPTREAVLSASRYGVSASVEYTAPVSLRRIEASPYRLEFGQVAPGATSDMRVTLKSGPDPVTVDDLTVDNALFSITSGGYPPFTIPANGSRILNVRFSPVSTKRVYGMIRIASNACVGSDIGLAGGLLDTGPDRPTTLQLLAPDGGERFGVGTDTVLTWANIPPETPVRLDYSIDAGVHWEAIADSARGLRHSWTIPEAPSDRCLARVSTYPARPESISIPHPSAVLDVAVSADSRVVATLRSPGDVSLWDAVTGTLIRRLGRHANARHIVFNRHGGELYSLADGEKRLSVWDLTTDPPTLQYSYGGLESITAFAVSGPCVVLGYASGAVTTNGCLDQPPFVSNVSGIRSLRYNFNGARLIAGTADGSALVWYASTGDMLHTFRGHGGPVISADFSIDDQYIVTADSHEVRVWKDLDGSLLRSFAIDSIVSVRFAPDGTSILVVAADRAIILDIVTGATRAVLSGHYAPVSAGEIGNSDLFAVTASLDSTARIWKIDDLAVQADLSDSLWAIVAPTLAGLDLDFGRIEIGRAKDSLVQGYIRNTGSFPVRIDGLRFVGGDSMDFSEAVPLSPQVLLPDSVVAVELRFKPSAAGLRSSTAEIVAGGGVLRQKVRGEGVAPALEVAARYIDFGQVDVGDRRDTIVDVVVRNIALVPMTITATTQIGPDLTQFLIRDGAGPFTLEPGEGRAMTLRFAPSRAGRTSGGIMFETDRAGVSAVAYLYGEGVDAGPSAPSIDAPTTRTLSLDGCSDEIFDTIVVVNRGRSPLRIDSLRLAGTSAFRFSLPVSLDGASVEPRDSLRIPLRFSTSIAGRYTAWLLIASNDPIDSLSVIMLLADRRLSDFRLSVDTVDFGMVCPGELRDTSIMLSNTGPVALDVAGTSESLFSVDRPMYRVDTMRMEPVRIVFAGSETEGPVVGKVVFVDTACGARHELVVMADVIAPRIEVASLRLISNGGRSVGGDLVIRNVSTRDVRVDAMKVGGSGLRVVGSLPIEIATGGEGRVGVEYDGGGTAGEPFTVEVTASPCSVVDTGIVEVEIRRQWTRVEVGSGSGRPGDVVKLPLRVAESAGVEEGTVLEYRAAVRFDRSVLLPTDAANRGTIDGDDRVVRLSGSGSVAGGLLGELEVTVGLGGVERTAVRLTEFEWSDSTIGVEEDGGAFTVLGLCGDPVSRLYRSDGRIGLKSVGVGVGGEELTVEYEVVEPGETELYLVDMLGRRVKEIVRGAIGEGRYDAEVDVGGLAVGLYLCVMRTPSRYLSVPFAISR